MKVSDFTKFISRYAKEASAIGNVLSTLISAIPLSNKQRADAGEILDHLTALPDILEKAANAIDNSNPVVIKKSDIIAAVSEVMPGMLDAAIARYMVGQDAAKAAKPAAAETPAPAAKPSRVMRAATKGSVK